MLLNSRVAIGGYRRTFYPIAPKPFRIVTKGYLDFF